MPRLARPLLLAALLAALPACSPTPHASPRPPADPTNPFSPTSLRVHPLTHIESRPRENTPEQSQLVLHFELLDPYGDSVKGLGTLHVELYKPGANLTRTMETQELMWDDPGMDAPETNTRRFDIATRTYRLPLLTPAWVAEAVSNGGWVKVHVSLTPPGAGREHILEDDYIVQQ